MPETQLVETINRESPEVEAYRLGILGLSKNLASQNMTLPNQQIAALSPLQQQSIQMAQQGVGAYQPYLQAGTQQLGGATTAYNNLSPIANDISGLASMAPGMTTGYTNTALTAGAAGAQAYDPNSYQAFMNPYTQGAIQPMLDEINRQQGMDQMTLNAQQVGRGSYGGTRAQLGESELNRNTMQTRNQLIAQQNMANFDQAQRAAIGTWDSQQGRMQNFGNMAMQAGQLGLAGQQLGISGLAQAGTLFGQQGEAMANLGQQYGQMGQLASGLGQEDSRFTGLMGALQQEDVQKRLDAAFNNANRQAYEPFQRASWLSDIYASVPSTQSTLSVTSAPGGSGLSTALGTGIQALAAYQGYNQLFNNNNQQSG